MLVVWSACGGNLQYDVVRASGGQPMSRSSECCQSGARYIYDMQQTCVRRFDSVPQHPSANVAPMHRAKQSFDTHVTVACNSGMFLCKSWAPRGFSQETCTSTRWVAFMRRHACFVHMYVCVCVSRCLYVRACECIRGCMYA